MASGKITRGKWLKTSLDFFQEDMRLMRPASWSSIYSPDIQERTLAWSMLASPTENHESRFLAYLPIMVVCWYILGLRRHLFCHLLMYPPMNFGKTHESLRALAVDITGGIINCPWLNPYHQQVINSTSVSVRPGSLHQYWCSAWPGTWGRHILLLSSDDLMVVWHGYFHRLLVFRFP